MATRELVNTDFDVSLVMETDLSRTLLYKRKINLSGVEYSLPNQFIVKQYVNRGACDDGDEFEEKMCKREERAYQKLYRLQGHLVPAFYGRVKIDASTKPAIAIQFCGDRTLYEYPHLFQRADEICGAIEDCYSQLSAEGVVPRDDKLGNLMPIEKDRNKITIMRIDFGDASLDHDVPTCTSRNREAVRWLCDEVRRKRRWL